MKAREVVLAILLIVFGVFTYYAKSGRLEINGNHGEGFFWGSAEEFVFEEIQEFVAPLPSELQVINSHGEVEIQGSPTDKISVTFVKAVVRKNRAEAQQVADKLKMIVQRQDPRLVLTTNRDEILRKNFDCRFRITVPAGMAVQVKNSYGLVRTVKTGSTGIANPHGAVKAGEIAGPLTVDNSFEDVDVHDIQADCRIKSSHAKIIAVAVQGDLTVDGSYCEIFLENNVKEISVKAPHSSVNGTRLKGSCEIKNSYERISLTDSGPAKITAHNSDIEVRGMDGPLEISDTNATLKISALKGNLRIEGPNLQIKADGVHAEDIVLSSSYENIWLLGFSGKATIVLNHGDLFLDPESVSAPIAVRATYANVRLGWPAGLKTPFEGEVKSGTIFWGLADRPAIEKSNGTSLTKAYPGEAGKPAIRIATTYGDIRVENAARPGKTI